MKSKNRRVLCLGIMLLLGSIGSLIYLALKGNSPQVYNDIILENTSGFSSNKSTERNLLFGLIFGGILIYFLWFLREQLNSQIKVSVNEKKDYVSDIYVPF